jgi:zinc protease
MLDPSAHVRVSGICNPINMEKVKQLIAEEFNKFADKGVTGEELAEAKRSYLESRGMNRTQDRSLGGILAGQLYAGRTMQQEADFEAKLKALTPDQVSAAVRKYYKPERLVIVTAGDFANASKHAGDDKAAAAGAGK